MPIHIAGGVFQFEPAPAPENKKTNRGRKSPDGSTTHTPLNVFVWKMFEENMLKGLQEHEALTDPQLIQILIQEFGHIEKIREGLTKRHSYYLAQLRSYFNRNVLVTGEHWSFPSFSMSSTGRLVIPDSGRELTDAEILKKLDTYSVEPDRQKNFLSLYKALKHG